MTNRADEPFQMTSECIDRYSVQIDDDGSATIVIVSPARFVDLWLNKLENLYAMGSDLDE